MPAPGPTAETAIGGALLTSPYWAGLLHDVSAIASPVAVTCGAIIGVHGVARIVVDLVMRVRARQQPPE